MKFLMFRGSVPQDRPDSEIKFNSIDESDCIYEHLAYHMGDEFCEIVYWNGNGREKWYSDKCVVRWVKDIKKYKPMKKPDVIFNRGGFKEPLDYIKANPKIYSIRYGAGKRYMPEPGIPYSLSLHDDIGTLQSTLELFRNIRCELWLKPVHPWFRRMDVKKLYDVAFVGNAGQSKIKGVKFVYKTSPKTISILHLGTKPKYKCPPNITRKRVLRKEMPVLLNRCKIGIVPYSHVDGAPRAMTEMVACGLPVIAFKGVRSIVQHARVNKEDFWREVDYALKDMVYIGMPTVQNLSIESCVKKLRSIINGNAKKDC